MRIGLGRKEGSKRVRSRKSKIAGGRAGRKVDTLNLKISRWNIYYDMEKCNKSIQVRIGQQIFGFKCWGLV